MTEVISVKFKTCGKNYYFAPNGIKADVGDRLIVETAKGLEPAVCSKGNHEVEDDDIIQPLRDVVRIATDRDIQTVEQNKVREKEAFEICKEKIKEHELDMKLVGVECNFEGTKTLFFFTSDGRVDFRELVKDLASIFHNRIELRQIGVRDEAKLIGGIGICGRPYCCSQFLEDFAPVSTKMAKVQSLSLNPAKISGSCGRLMCCLRYEEEAYEDLVREVPKLGAFVETVDGYGVVNQVSLLRKSIKVRLDGESEESIHTYDVSEVAVVPGGRPADGQPYPKVLLYDPDKKEEKFKLEEPDPWASPSLFADDLPDDSAEEVPEEVLEEAPSGDEPSGKSRKGKKPGMKMNRKRRFYGKRKPSNKEKGK